MTEDLYLHRLYEGRFNVSVIEYNFNLHGEIIRKENLTNFVQNSFPLAPLLLVHNVSWLQVIIINNDSLKVHKIKPSYFASNGVHLVTKLFNSQSIIDDYKKLKQTLSGLFSTNFNTVNIVTKPIMISDGILYQYYSNPSICHDLYKSFIRLMPKNNKLNRYMGIGDPYASMIHISSSTHREICSKCDITRELRFNYNAHVNVILDSSQDAKYSIDNILQQDIQGENSKEYVSWIKNTNLTSHIYDNNINFKRHVYLYNYNEVNNLNITITEIIPNYYELKFRGYYFCVMPLAGINYTTTKSTYTSENLSNCKVITDYQFTYHIGNHDSFPSISWNTIVPSNSKIVISSSYSKLFMNFEQYPADAYKGFEVYPVVIYFNFQNYDNLHFHTTESLLLSFPIGDFSMPFNVITLVSTIFAFLVGSVINTLVKNKINK